MLFKNQRNNLKKFIIVFLFSNIWGGINLYSYVQDTNKRIDIFGLTSTDDTNNGEGYDIYIIKNPTYY